MASAAKTILTVAPDSPAKCFGRVQFQSVGDMAAHVLVVDDDPVERRHIENILTSQGHSVESVAGGEAALARLAKSAARPFSAMFLDLVMPDHDGMAVLERLARGCASDVPAIVLAARADAGASALRAGATDFIVKPASPERVKASLTNALKISALESELQRIRLGRSGALSLADIASRAPSMERVRRVADRAARSSLPILIEGERGVGKDLLAGMIHGSSARRAKPFVTVGCRDLPEVGGNVSHLGDRRNLALEQKLDEASGGTLFLDDIGALPKNAQAALARMLADGASTEPAKAHALPGDVRLIAATHRRLIDVLPDNGFDRRLFDLLNVMPIWLPPLRERVVDIPDLARSFAARIAAEAGRPNLGGVSAAAMELLRAHSWPGNVRELEHAILRATMLCEGGELVPENFPSVAAGGVGSAPASGETRGESRQPGLADQKRRNERETRSATRGNDRITFARYGVARLLDERGEMRPFGALEEEVIRFAIEHYRGQMSEVARRLGIGRSTLYRKIRDYGIAPEASVVS